MNKLIGPVKSQFGYYVIKVDQDQPGDAADAGPVHGADQADASTSQLQTQAQTAVDNHAKKDWLEQDHVPQAVRDGRLQRLQGAQDDLHRRRGRRRDGRRGRRDAPPRRDGSGGTAAAAPCRVPGGRGAGPDDA